MQCYNPLTAYKTFDGKVVFDESRKADTTYQLQLPCGQCTGCKLERSRQWAARCMHEAQMHKENCFITLTYNNDNLKSLSLEYRDFQLFMKKLRKALGSGDAIRRWYQEVSKREHAYMGVPPIPRAKEIRFYMCGEYGENNSRPHFHAAIFGYDFPDKLYHAKTEAGSRIYISAQLSKLWDKGFSSIGELTFESAAYIARYIMKKVTDENQTQEERKWREILDPDSGEILARRQEFNNMSRGRGIGKQWIEKYETDVYPTGEMIIRGHKTKSARYYDQHYQKKEPLLYEEMQHKRNIIAKENYKENTNDRLKVKEKVTKAKIKTLLRKI